MAWQQEAVVERSNVVVEKKVGSCNNWSGKKSFGGGRGGDIESGKFERRWLELLWLWLWRRWEHWKPICSEILVK